MANDDILWDYSLENTVYGRLLGRTLERVKALNLKCIASDKIEIRKLAWSNGEKDTLQPPYIIISPRPEITNWKEGSSERDATAYAAMITVVLANGRDSTIQGMGLQFEWRQQLRRAFQNKVPVTWPELQASLNAMTGVDFVHSFIEAGDQFLDAAKRMQYDAQYWLVRFNVWEPRT